MHTTRLGHGEDTPCAHCGHPMFVGDWVYSVDEVLWGCSKGCATAAEAKAQKAYEDRLLAGLRCHGLERYCQMNPLLREDILRLAKAKR